MQVVIQNFLISLPLFLLIALGWVTAKIGIASVAMGNALSKFSYNIGIPLLLFTIMSNIGNLPAPDWKIAFAFFGSCFTVFFIGRLVAKNVLRLDTDSRTIFGMASVFSNNVQLGIPVAIALLGEKCLPSIAVIFALNGFLMWTLATVCIEIGRAQSTTLAGTLTKGIIQPLKNPIVVGIVCGSLRGFTGLELPAAVQKPIDLLAASATPVALFSIGIGLTQFRITTNPGVTGAITLLKLGVQPMCVFLLAKLLSLSHDSAAAACLLACLPVGVNVWVMAQEFNAMQGPTATSLLITTLLASVTMPVLMSALGLL